ncbi:MAG: VWA domain-containing protein, partial [Bacteroidota bacterium]|nr:VWA domain-containing protein [Bacteroidota bacterium]
MALIHERRRGCTILLTAACLSLAVAASALQAQPVINFKRIANIWPMIDLYFSVECSGTPVHSLGKQAVRVAENDLPIDDFTLHCPDPSVHCPVSTALVFDASGSMAGAGNSGAKAAGHAFIDLMDGMSDEAAVLWFGSVVTVRQTMTRDKDLLHAAVDSLPAAGGSTPLWNAISMGIMTLVNYETNPCYALIVLTDGGDNASSTTPAEIISLAVRERVRVFTIALGVVFNAAVLRNIADMTGGAYYEVNNAAQLPAIYEGIFSLISAGFRECRLTYESKCMDGGTRDVALSVSGLCNGTDSKIKSYKAPKDTSTFIPLTFRLGRTIVRGGGEAALPLELADPLSRDLLYPLTFTLQHDRTGLRFARITAPEGSLLHGVPIQSSTLPGGVNVWTTGRKIIEVPSAPALMAELHFRADDPEGKDTIRNPVRFTAWTFAAGCFRPVLADGEVLVIPRIPAITCELDAPREVTWNRMSKDYVPNPFAVSMTVVNTGDREARNARFRIDWKTETGGENNPADLVLVSPGDRVQSGSPPTVYPSDSSRASWDIRVNRRMKGDSIRICVTGAFDNDDSLTCCKTVWVPPADPVLRCSVWIPPIRFDSAKQQYEPMPFTVSARVWNEGGKKTDTVFARIVIPSQLQLYGPDAPNRTTKKTIPAMLAPGQVGDVDWLLWHPVTITNKEYTVGVWVYTANGDSSYCEAKVSIPWIDGPVLSPVCTAPDSLHFNETRKAYEPKPFTVRLACTNVGPVPAANVTAFLYLPANVELADKSEPLHKPFPSPLDKWKAGDPVPSVTWNLQYTKKTPCTIPLDVKFVVGGTDSTGIPTDSAESVCRIVVPGRPPSVSALGRTAFCEGDSVTLVADEGYDEYLWSNGDTARTTVVRVSGSYSVTVRNTDGCSGTSQPVQVSVLQRPKPSINALGPTSFCEGDSVTLVADDGYDEYLWSNGDTTRTTVVRTAGSYTVTVRLAGGCSGTSQP